MSMSDPISDMLTRIRNASNAKLPRATMPSSNFLGNSHHMNMNSRLH